MTVEDALVILLVTLTVVLTFVYCRSCLTPRQIYRVPHKELPSDQELWLVKHDTVLQSLPEGVRQALQEACPVTETGQHVYDRTVTVDQWTWRMLCACGAEKRKGDLDTWDQRMIVRAGAGPIIPGPDEVYRQYAARRQRR